MRVAVAEINPWIGRKKQGTLVSCVRAGKNAHSALNMFKGFQTGKQKSKEDDL